MIGINLKRTFNTIPDHCLRATRNLFFLLLLTLSLGGVSSAAAAILDYHLWQDGVVPYRFEEGTYALSAEDRAFLRAAMDRWEQALTFTDPLNSRSRTRYIRFAHCPGNACMESHVRIRYNDPSHGEDGNMCHYFDDGEKLGRNTGGSHETVLHFGQNQDAVVMLHELGHCLGLWHETKRGDWDEWLQEAAGWAPDSVMPGEKLPLLGNFDFDSIMLYGSYGRDTTLEYRDVLGNAFSRQVQGARVSERDVSRLLQYYANERYPKWGFFGSLSRHYADPEKLANPYLAPGVEAVGTPAISFQRRGNYDIFVRGSDQGLYWKAFREDVDQGWASLRCCIASDPSAISPRDGSIDVVAVTNEGNVIRKHYENGVWGDSYRIHEGYPAGGIRKSLDGGYIGPAIVSRGADAADAYSLDVFVVRRDGRLAVTTRRNGAWSAWTALGSGYSVTARPAAVRLSGTEVQLAINESDFNLFEPRFTYPSDFTLGSVRGTTAFQAPPAVTWRGDQTDKYRVLIRNAYGRVSHRITTGAWLDIGGVPRPGTGPSVVGTGGFNFLVVMNGEDATGCDISCIPGDAPVPKGTVVQPGGLWLRSFD
jgi:hypothetical protein